MQTLTTQRTANGVFETFWGGKRTRYTIQQTANLWSGNGARRVARYAIMWAGKDGEPKSKTVGSLHAAKRLLAQRLAAKSA